MDRETRIADDCFEVRMGGSLSFTDHGAFRAILKEMTTSGRPRCVFDLTGLESIDSAGLGMLLIACEEAERGKLSFALRAPQGQVKRMLELARFADVMTVET